MEPRRKTNSKSLTLSDGAALHLDGDLVNNGTLSLGRASRLSLDGAFTQPAAGTFAVTIDGRPASGAFGALQAAGPATLDGTLAVSTGSGFSGVTDDRFPILRYASVSGGFAQRTGLDLAGGLAFAPQQGAGALNLRVGELGSTRAALEASAVTATGTFVPGDDIHVSYTVANAGDATTAGSWSDAVYLSTDGAVDASDTLLGRATHQGDLAHGASYDGALTAKLPGLLRGTYRVLVVADSSGANPANPVGAAASAPLTLVVVVTPEVVPDEPKIDPPTVSPTPTSSPTPAPAPFNPSVTVRGAASASAKYRGKRTFTLQIRNAGTLADAVKLRGTGNRPGFSVRYLAGSKDVTKAVEKGTYKTATLKSGATVTLKLVVTVSKKGKRTGSWTLTAAKSTATVKLKVT